MRLFEIFEDDNSESKYLTNLKSTLVDYLTSFFATGAKNTKVEASKIIMFLKNQGFDIMEGQLESYLEGSSFRLDGKFIVVDDDSSSDSEDGPNEKQQQDFNQNRVQGMARKQLSKEF